MPVEGELHRVVGRTAEKPVVFIEEELSDSGSARALKGERQAYVDPQGFQPVPVYDGYALRPGNVVVGPAIVERMGDSVHLPPNFEARLDAYRTMWITTIAPPVVELVVASDEGLVG